MGTTLWLYLLLVAQTYRNIACAHWKNTPCKDGIKSITMDLNVMKEQYNYSSRYNAFSVGKAAGLSSATKTSQSSYPKKIAAVTSSDNVCGKRFLDIGGIIDGDDAPQTSWPWQVVVYLMENKVCGGVLVDRLWVLTAAHCMQYPRLTRIGMSNLSLTEDGVQNFKVIKTVVHENYRQQDGRPVNDLGLLKLHRPVLFTTSVFPACLPTDAQGDFRNVEECYISGFGATKTFDPPYMPFDSPVLKELKVKIVPFVSCAWNYKMFNITISNADICFKPHRLSNAGPCVGDSGGPLSCKVNGIFYVAGIASFVFPGCYRNAPFAYVKISAYSEWILDVIKNN